MRSTLILLIFLLGSLAPLPEGFGQSDKPVIIRDTDIAEGIEDEVEQMPKERNPDEARKNIEVGNFYYKRQNYAGAILRYLTAIEYQQDSDKAYKSLVRAYESMVEAYESIDPRDSLGNPEEKYGLISVAIEGFTEFLRIYPDFVKKDDLNRMLGKLEEISSRFNKR